MKKGSYIYRVYVERSHKKMINKKLTYVYSTTLIKLIYLASSQYCKGLNHTTFKFTTIQYLDCKARILHSLNCSQSFCETTSKRALHNDSRQLGVKVLRISRYMVRFFIAPQRTLNAHLFLQLHAFC